MNYSVVIHTCDKYKDCWEPFWKCFNKYWTDPHCDIYFVNEYADVDVPQIKTGGGAWSDRLLVALDRLPDTPIFYMLEDFWINREVDVRKYFDLFTQINADSLRIVYPSPLVTLNYEYGELYQVDSNSRYILSLQPSFWKKDFLRSALIRGEDPWQFETTGTDRLRNTGYKSKAYFVDEDWYVGAYHRGKILPEGSDYLKQINEW